VKTATVYRIEPPGSVLTVAGKPLAIGDTVTEGDVLTLATPDGKGGCVSLTAQIAVTVATKRLAPVEPPPGLAAEVPQPVTAP